MKKVKRILNEIFIEGLSGMATGLFTGLCARFLLEKLPEKLKKW